MKVIFTCAKKGEKAQTIRTSQFDIKFNEGEYYRITFADGRSTIAKVTRKGTTMYVPAADFPVGFKRAVTGKNGSVAHKVKSIKQIV